MFAKCELLVSATVLFLFFGLLNCCVSSFLWRIHPSSLLIIKKRNVEAGTPANSWHERRREVCLQALATRWFWAVSKLISAALSDDELIISESTRCAVPPPHTRGAEKPRYSVCVRVWVWVDARGRPTPQDWMLKIMSTCTLTSDLWPHLETQ